jgi:hypothetical protein
MESQEITFCQRPTLIESLRRGPEINLVSNYMKMSFKPNNKYVRQYHMKFEPDIPAENEALRRSIRKGISKQLREMFSPFVISGDSMFSVQNQEGEVTIGFSYTRPEQDPVDYKITITNTGNELDISNVKSYMGFTPQVKHFVETVVKSILGANRGMVRFNSRSIFNYEESIQLTDFGKYFLKYFYFFLNFNYIFPHFLIAQFLSPIFTN